MNMPTNICHEAFAMTEFNKILLGKQSCQEVKILCFRDTVPETETAQQDFILHIHQLWSVIWQRNVCLSGIHNFGY